MDFIAIDFEIANSNMSSACSLGMAFVKDNQIIDEKYYLLHPPTMDFDQKMVNVHGIKPIDVLSAKNFKLVWEEIKEYFSYNLIIAHNAQFDMSVLYSCLEEYSLEMPAFYFMDSIQISSKAINGKVSSSLKDRLSHFNIEIKNHHNAKFDAKACANLVIKSFERLGKSNIHSFLYEFNDLTPKRFAELNPQKEFRKRQSFNKKIAISQISATVETFNTNHALFGKNVVFTGELQTIDRKAAMQAVVNLGGNIKSTVSSKTDILVLGIQDKLLVGEQGISTKENKAFQLIADGKNIKVLREKDFLRLLEL